MLFSLQHYSFIPSALGHHGDHVFLPFPSSSSLSTNVESFNRWREGDRCDFQSSRSFLNPLKAVLHTLIGWNQSSSRSLSLRRPIPSTGCRALRFWQFRSSHSMKQPARISASESIPQLVLVNQVSTAATSFLQEIPVDPEAAKFLVSWYSWAPLVMSCGGGAE
jgi:hypothetical protein